ncbi:putative serine protease 46 [Orchesella cincta]|uniref:Putative serine protease 46 n=1 Tax=Orchesella cincta TaxID=48709 RepID=A0A1D2MNR6_ORCCI|nr:putative serine protease 46 [Orchesella cincta]
MAIRRSEYRPSVIQSLGIYFLVFSAIFCVTAGYGYGSQDQNQYSVQPSYYKSSYNYSPPNKYEKQETKVYTAISYRELNTSYHCGVIPDTNYELYRKSSDPYEVADVVPYGKFPWIVLIVYKNQVVCQGTLIHANLVLTSANCIPDYTSLEYYEIRFGDWDLLTDYNEYEAYKDKELRVCSRHSVTKKYYGKGNSGGNYGYGYQPPKYYAGDDYSDLIVLKSDYVARPDKLPQVKHLCLPKTYASSYGNNYYGSGGGGSSYNKNYNSYSSYSTCWVAGWYGSEITQLSNHPQPQKVQEYSYGYYPSGGDYYYQQYYKGYDSSMIQKRAKVKQVPCPYDYSSGYGSYSSSSQICFIGVDGYDACVAERGAAVFCTVQEKQNYGQYDSGYNNYNQDNDYQQYQTYKQDDPYSNVQSNLHPEYKDSSSYHYATKTIRVKPSPPKPYRYRAVIYAVIQKAAKCRKGYDSYGSVYYRKSSPVVATKVDYDTVDSVLDVLWTHGYDYSCPVCKAKYKAGKKSYKYNYYFGGYQKNNNYYKGGSY